MFTRSLRSTLLIVCVLVLITIVVSSSPTNSTAHASTTGKPSQVTLSPGTDTDGQVTPSGNNTTYLSAVVEAEAPFTHMLLRWEASGGLHDHDHEHEHADEATDLLVDPIRVEIRSSRDGHDWQPWVEAGHNHDLWVPEDGEDTYWSEIIYADEGARFWQVRATMQPDAEGHLPELHNIDVNTVDARFGPADSEMQPDAPAAASNIGVAGLSKPAVISRSAWGNPDGQGSRVRPAYYPVKHMVVHHTADPNTFRSGESSWGDRVRAIWSFHTYTRGWGDVGYNYLIDPNGTIYEGRAGGDDAVGFHDTGNYGSMGVSLVGTYSNATPTPAMQDSLVRLLAWKAAQKGINPLGSAYYYGCDISRSCGASGAVIYNIAGHRHITGTSCPGQRVFDMLPSIRNRVQKAINNGGTGGPAPVPDNGDLLVDELETSFARSDANWYSASCGYGGHTFYTYATDGASENSATWRPNLPESGRYKVYAAIPQGCGLGSPPYASTRARYRVVHAGGTSEVTADHNTAEQWAYLGSYTFNQGNGGAVELYDTTGESINQSKVLFFDSVRWVRDTEATDLQLVNVQYDRSSVAVGELLKVVFTVKNTGEVAIHGQAPQAGTRPGGEFDLANSYVYDEGECFLGNEKGEYPVYDKETARFRLMLGTSSRSLNCAGSDGGYPWRWGINGTMQPGETRDVVGYIRFREPGNVTLRAGIIQEYVDYFSRDQAVQTIRVTDERLAPVPASYDNSLQPQAHAYRMGTIPANFLGRTANPLSVLRGEYVGSFAWNGSQIKWNDSGPFGLRDLFVVEQTRIMHAPVAGEYTFRTTSDDGSWLWVNGQQVVLNHGLHAPDSRTGSIYLNAGMHVVSFKYFEFTGEAMASYDVQLPGRDDFGTLRDSLTTSGIRVGNTFRDAPRALWLAADDQGGIGMSRIRYSINGGAWRETAGGLMDLGRLTTGSYTIRYAGIDKVGNQSGEQTLRININPDLEIKQMFLPFAAR